MNFLKSIITIPNVITMVRIVLIPFVVTAILSSYWYCVFFLFLAATLTDFLDGFLARYWNDHSALGELLDPVADKLLLFSCFGALAYGSHGSCGVPFWFVALIGIKELFLVIGFLFIRFFVDVQFRMPATLFGKITGSLQWAFVIFVVLGKMFLFECNFLYNVLIIFTVVLALCALVHYGYMSYKKLVK